MFILFLFLFIIGVVGIAVIVARKIPLVLQTPRDVVNDYFLLGSSRMHVRLLRIRAWIRQGAYWDPFLTFLARTLRWLRVGLLKLDRYSFSLQQTIKEKSEERKTVRREQETNLTYWEELKPDQPKETPADKDDTTLV